MDPTKQHLLLCMKMINNARDETIDVIRREPMSNLKLLERASKCLKDPNPLSTTMSMMSLKYPLSVDFQKTIDCKMPEHLYHVDNKHINDTHYHGRILCKKEALEWWVDKAEETKEETEEVINVLMRQHRKEVSSYYKINWKRVHIQWGTPSLERRRVSTRTPVINIDPSIRDQALMQTLMPDFITPYRRVTETDLKEIRELSQLTLAGKMSLASQIRVLMNQMDSKRRVLPILAGSSEITAPLKHALTHTNFVVIGYETEEMRGSPIVQRLLEKFGKNLQYEYVHSHLDLDLLRTIISNSRCLGKELSNYLKNPDLIETNYVKWMKVVYGQSISSESESSGLKTSPVPGKIKIRRVENMSGARYIIYEGRETVNFKFNDVRGSFVHNGPIIHKITTNYTTIDELINCIREVAIYCRWGMQGTYSKSYQGMKNEIRDSLHMKPHLAINCSAAEFNALVSQKIPLGSAGALNLVSDSEYRPCSFINPYIDNQGNISSRTTNQSIHFPQQTTYPDPIPEEIDCKHKKMMNHFNFKRLLKYKIQYYLENRKELKLKVLKGEFDWENKIFIRYIKENRILSKTCRDLLIGMMEDWDSGVAAFYYCFSFQSPLDIRNIRYEFLIQGQIIDLKAKKGVFRYQTNEGGYFLYGQPLSKIPEKDYAAPLSLLLDGYRLSTITTQSAPVRSIKYLEDQRDEIVDGSTFTTFVSGKTYMATRDSTAAFSVRQTINRQVNARKKKSR